MEKSRIAALADGIFAVAMTLLVLDLKLPEAVETTTDAEVWQQVVDLKGHFMMYGLSFIVLSSSGSLITSSCISCTKWTGECSG